MNSVRRSLPRALRDLLAPRKRVGDPSQNQVNAVTRSAAIELILVESGPAALERSLHISCRSFRRISTRGVGGSDFKRDVICQLCANHALVSTTSLVRLRSEFNPNRQHLFLPEN